MPAGKGLLQRVALAPAFQARLDSARRLIDALDFEVELFTKLASGRLRGHPGYTAIQTISGVGPVLAAVFVAEIGEVSRFRRAAQLASWAGLTPKHHESDTTVHRGAITKQGPGWCAGPQSKPSSAPISTVAWAKSVTGSGPAAATTSAKSPPPASSSNWFITG